MFNALFVNSELYIFSPAPVSKNCINLQKFYFPYDYRKDSCKRTSNFWVPNKQADP